MQNAFAMTQELDQQRKRNALLLTLGTGGALLLLFILLRWPIPTISQPVVEEYIDVNLGNSDVGSGNDQPQIPGAPAPLAAAIAPAQPAASNDVRQVETDDNAPSDAPVIRNPVNANPKATKINDDNKSVKAATATTTAPPAPVRKAVFPGLKSPNGNGPGGNGADTYKPGTGEGPGNGTGDAGSLGGNPKGGSYRNDRQVIKEYYFQSDLPPATVKAELLIDRNGKASLRRITNGSMAKYRNAIESYLPVMSFNKSDHESVIVYTFNFRTTGG
jgi:hypothetical protein